MNSRAEIDSFTTKEINTFRKANLKIDVNWATHSLRFVTDKGYHDATVAYIINSPGSEPIKIIAEPIIV